MSLVLIPLFFVIGVLGGALEGGENFERFLGGLHWQAFTLAVWETFLMVGIMVFLLYFFRERLNQAGPIAEIHGRQRLYCLHHSSNDPLCTCYSTAAY
jgi:hypothetical protein